MVTNIDTGRDDGNTLDPLMVLLLAAVLVAVCFVGFFMWTSYQGSSVPRAPTDIKITFKHMSVGKR
jgi:hypothetical protein